MTQPANSAARRLRPAVRWAASIWRLALARGVVLFAACLLCACHIPGCRKQDGSTPGQGAPPALPEPDLSALEPVSRSAIAAAQEVVGSRPSDADALGHLGMMYHAHGLFDVAVACYRQAVPLAPQAFTWRYYIGVALTQSGKAGEAAAALDEALKLRPTYLPAVQALGDVQASAGEVEPARRAYQRALELDAHCAAARFGLARLELGRKDFAAALPHLEAALAADPGCGMVQSVLARTYQELGRPEEARRVWVPQGQTRAPFLPDPEMDKVAVLATGSAAEYQRGRLALAEGKMEAGLRHLREAVNLKPQSAEYRIALAMTLVGADRLDDAERHCQAVLEREPTQSDALYVLALVQAGRGRREEAIGTLRKCLETNPNQVAALTSLGALLREGGQLGQAVMVLERAVQLDPGGADAHHNLGMVYRAQNRRDDAIRELRLALEKGPDASETHANLAELLEAAGDATGAIEHNRAALKAQPGHEDACANLGRLLFLQARYDEAADVLRAGLAGAPSSRRIAGQLVWLLSTCPDEAIRNGQEAVGLIERLCPGESCKDPTLIDARAAAYAEVGRFDEAVALAERLVDLAAATRKPDLYQQTVMRMRTYLLRRPYRMTR